MKQMLTSIIMLITSILLFTAVVYAWFTITNESNIKPANFDVTNEFDYDYEIKYYTNKYIYRYHQETQSIQVYDSSSSSWVSPINLPGGPVYLIDGVFISQYDVLIPENNYKNNLIIEISIVFTNDDPMYFTQRLMSEKSISSQIASSMDLETSRAYYVSEVVNIQTFSSSSYNHYAETFNKYEILNTEFNTVNGTNNLIYPKYSFYQNNVYQPILDLGQTFVNPGSTIRYYYNFSYDNLRVSQFFNQEFQSSTYDVTNIPMILFFQDVEMVLTGGGNS
ncbi:MAG: hypothetical protein Q7I99_06455 [Acholeplasmataceae bacterium]|nr:hypothetical protein [Acholeplasmataceae bacterium]